MTTESDLNRSMSAVGEEIKRMGKSMRPVSNYTTDFCGHIAVPNLRAGFLTGYADPLPVILGGGKVRELAREVADAIIEAARHSSVPVAWITSNQYMPPLRDITAAETVWQAANNDDGELWAWFTEMVEDRMSAANVALECPDWDNALYAVDLNRWQYRDEIPDDEQNSSLNDEWEPVDPAALDDNRDNPRE